MIWGKHQRFTVRCIYFPVVWWDFKELVDFRFLWIDAAIFHTWLNSWNFCVHVCEYSLSACTVLNLGILHHYCNTLLKTYLFLPLLCLQGLLPSSCQDVRSMNGPLPDGEHYLNIQGKALRVRIHDLITWQTHKELFMKPQQVLFVSREQHFKSRYLLYLFSWHFRQLKH